MNTYTQQPTFVSSSTILCVYQRSSYLGYAIFGMVVLNCLLILTVQKIFKK